MKERLKELRKKNGFPRREDLVAKIKAGMSSVSQWERGEKLPSAKDGIELAELYGVTLDYLYLGKEDRGITSSIPDDLLRGVVSDLEYIYENDVMLFSRVCGEISGYRIQSKLLKTIEDGKK